MAIYATNFVVTRYSMLSGLQPLDLVALRYLVAGALLWPSFARLGLRTLSEIGWRRGIVLTWLAGAPYMITFYSGLRLAPASHGAILNPGIVPSVVFLGLVATGRQRFSPLRAVSLMLILVGLVLVTGSSFTASGAVLRGDAILFASGISWGLFTLLARLWELKPLPTTAVVSVLSMAYLPFYLLLAVPTFSSVSIPHLLAQGVFQGIVISIGSMYLITYAVRQLGAQLTALFSPLVPVITTLLAIPLLGEVPSASQWGGVIMVVAGMVSAARFG